MNAMNQLSEYCEPVSQSVVETFGQWLIRQLYNQSECCNIYFIHN